MPEQDSQYGQQRWVIAFNDAGEEAPAFGCVKIKSVDSDGVISFEKSDGSDPHHAFIGHQPITDQTFGEITFDFPTWALYDTGSPVTGNRYKPKNASFDLVADAGGEFVVLGGDDGTKIVVDRQNISVVGLSWVNEVILKAQTANGTTDIDFSNRFSHQFFNSVEGNTTFTFTDPDGLALYDELHVYLRDDTNGPHTLTWPSNVKWTGAALLATSGANTDTELVIFRWPDGTGGGAEDIYYAKHEGTFA